MQTKVGKVAAKARQDKKLVFTSLAHHINAERLWNGINAISESTASGVDDQTVEQAKEHFPSWSAKILQSMHQKGYRPPPTRRVHIPKPGKVAKRPISIPTVQDRCLQKAVADVLNSIYEEDFLDCSFGGRPGRSAHQAIANLQEAISKHKVNWIYEADLKNFFGSLNHGWVERFLNHRVGDPRITTLIRRWLKAGYLEDGQHHQNAEGAAQGGPISVLVSNLYLHYVLDLWVEKVVKPRMRGYVYYVRYLDDFVLCFEIKEDALRFQRVISRRLDKFSLAFEPTKTKLFKFGRFASKGNQKGDAKRHKAETFNFLGFTFYCTRNQKGWFKVGLKTEKSRFKRSFLKLKETMLRNRHLPIREQWKKINVILSGHYQYYGVGGNIYALTNFHYLATRWWRKVLSTRSQKGKVHWDKFNHILKLFPLRRPKLSLPYAAMRKLVVL